MKIRETKTNTLPPQGVSGYQPVETWERVRELADGETLPAGAEEVPKTTPVTDWVLKETK